MKKGLKITLISLVVFLLICLFGIPEYLRYQEVRDVQHKAYVNKIK